jgi:hypothetical protein
VTEHADWVRQVVGGGVSESEAAALAAYYATLAKAVAAFSTAELRDVEPPLRSVPGPLA